MVELGSVEVAQSVGCEVAEPTHRPVDVLETTVGVVRGCHAEELLKLLVPGGWNVGNFDLFIEHPSFQPKPE